MSLLSWGSHHLFPDDGDGAMEGVVSAAGGRGRPHAATTRVIIIDSCHPTAAKKMDSRGNHILLAEDIFLWL